MKVLKRLVGIFVFFTLIGVVAMEAQRLTPRIDASIGFSNGDYKVKHLRDFSGKTIMGYRLSATLDVPLVSVLYLNSGLVFHSKGSKADVAVSSDMKMSPIKTKIHYLEIPVQLGVRFNLPFRLFCQVQAGPYFSYAMSGTAEVKDLGVKNSYDLFKHHAGEFFKVKGKRFDTGIGVSAILGRGRLYALLGADFGLVNTIDDAVDKFNSDNFDMTMKNASFHFGIGCRF